MSRLEEMLCFQVYALHHAFGRQYQAAFAGTGFTYAKFLVLKALDESGSMSLSALATRLGLEPNTLSPLVKKMASVGVIQRIRSAEDERRIVLSNSAYGDELLQAAEETMNALMASLDVSAEEVTHAITLLSRIRGALDQVEAPSIRAVSPEKVAAGPQKR